MDRKAYFMLALALFLTEAAYAADPCGSLETAFGPFDYRTASAHKKRIVETFHFTDSVENLVRGNTTKWVAGDISYVLRAFPNHIRALAAITELVESKFNEEGI